MLCTGAAGAAIAAKETFMLLSILQHTPLWVWIIFTVLLGVGTLQTRTRSISVGRATVLPLVFVALSLSGVVRGAAGSGMSAPHSGLPFAAWFIGFAAVWWVGRRGLAVQGARWLDAERRIEVPGSWMPLMLMGGLFVSKYLNAVVIALEPALAHATGFVAGGNLLFGAFAAVFWIRARSLNRLVPPAHRVLPARAAFGRPENSQAKSA